MDHLKSQGLDVIGLDLRPSRYTAIVADCRRLPTLPNVDAIVHCAAQVSVPASVQDPREDAAQNVDGTLAILELARKEDASVVYLSSAAVYGDVKVLPISEEAHTSPATPYGLSKLTGERYTMLYHSLYGLHACAVRPFNIFSPRQDPGNPYSGVISKFAAAFRANKAISIFGTGEQTRDFIHARDVASAIALLIQNPRANGQTMNLGTGLETSILGLAEAMSGRRREEISIRFEPAREGDIVRSVADVTRLRSLGFSPTTNMVSDLKEML